MKSKLHWVGVLMGAMTTVGIAAPARAAEPDAISGLHEKPRLGLWVAQSDESQSAGQTEEIQAAPAGEGETKSDVGDSNAPPTGDRSPTDAVVGHIGFGYFTNLAPIGMRYWLTRDMALDAGIDVAFSSGEIGAQRYGAELGFVYALAHYYYAVVFARAGLGFTYTNDTGDPGLPTRWSLGGTAVLGAELFLGAFGFPNVSLQGGYGLELTYQQQIADGGQGAGGAFVLGTAAPGLSIVGSSTFGFHIYF